MLIYTKATGLQEVASLPCVIPVGMYTGTRMLVAGIYEWELRVTRRGSGHKWKYVPKGALPKQLKLEALLLGLTL